MSISLSLDGAMGLFRCMILQGVFPLQSAEAAINARGHIWLSDSRGSSCHATMLELAGIYCVRVGVCVCWGVYVWVSGSSAVVEPCKYSSQLPPPAPVWQRLQAVRSRLRVETLSEYRWCQSREQRRTIQYPSAKSIERLLCLFSAQTSNTCVSHL